MNPLWVVLPVLLLLSVATAVRRSRRRRLARLRAEWGTPMERARRIDAMSASHVSRMATLGGASLDERTWADLNLDDVFAAVDRTQSTLGQHALYHRLRTAPLGAHLEAFEALVDRMTADTGVRERAQMALARLQDPHGYDVWWLARPGAVQRRSWYAVFPVLTASTILLVALALFSSSAVVPLVAVLVLNVAVRYATDSRIGTIARSFRQCAPLIATAESLGFLGGNDIDPIVSPLRTDVPGLARLKLISRWMNGDPFMLPVNADPLVVPLSDLVAALYEYLNLALLLDATGVYLAVKDLSRYGVSLARATAAAGERRGVPKPHVVLAATHDGELVDLVSETFDAYHFGDSVGPDGLMFDHRLRHGPATTRNAIALLRLHGAPETLLARAVTTAEMLDRQRGTTLVAR